MKKNFIIASRKSRFVKAGMNAPSDYTLPRGEKQGQLRFSAALVNLKRKPRTFSPRKFIEKVKAQEIIDDGFLYIVESSKIPFEIKRVYTIIDANVELPRGYHAHRSTEQAVFCLRGGLRITLDNGLTRSRIELDSKKLGRGVIQRKMVWIEMDHFLPGTILLVLSSKEYDLKGYIRSYHQFVKEAKKASQAL